MKQLSIFITCLFLFVTTFAQKTDTIPAPKKMDTTKIKIGNVEIIIKDNGEDSDVTIKENGKKKEIASTKKSKTIIKKKKKDTAIKTRWLLMDIGLNSYLAEDQLGQTSPLDLRHGKSVEVDLYVFKQRIGIFKNHVNLNYGLGFNFNNYRFTEDIRLVPDQDRLTVVEDTETNYSKVKLATTSLEVPLMLNFETKPNDKDKSFRIGVGGYGKLLLSAHTKHKSDSEGKVKVRDNFGLNSFNYGLKGELGIGPVNLYVKYALNPLFQDNPLPEMMPVSAGISLLSF